MNETKKASKPVRRRRSVRKFRRYSSIPAAATENLEVSIEKSSKEDSPVIDIVDVEETNASEPSPDFVSEKQAVQSDSNTLDSTESKVEEQIDELAQQILESDSEALQDQEVFDDDQETNPRIDLAKLKRTEEEIAQNEVLDAESDRANETERRSSAPPSESVDGSVSSDDTVKRTRVISIPPDPPATSIETEKEGVYDRISQEVVEQDVSQDLDIPETPIEEIESIEEGDIDSLEEPEEEEVLVRDSDLSLESEDIDEDESETEVEEITAQSVDDADQKIVESVQERHTEVEPKEELTEADLERAIEWVDEDSIDEIDQSDLIESRELADLPDEQAPGIPTPIPEAEESVEVEHIPPEYSARLSPPPSPPDTKAKRISVRPPPHPPGIAQSAQTSTSAQTVERASSVPATEEKTPAARPAKTPRPWWESFFSEDYLRTVMPLTPPQISKQCDFILASLGLERGSTILDVGCGLGLHSVELTVRGYLVVGLDLSLPMVTRAAEEAQYRGLKINFLHADIRQIEFEGAFDAVICMGTTFGFFDDESNRDVLSRLHGALKPGGKLLLDVVNRDFAIGSQPNLVWFQGDDCVCMEESEFNFSTSRLHVKRTVMQEDGRQSDSEYSIRLYSLHELNSLLRQEGFRVLEVSGQEATRGIFFGVNAPRVLLLAMRTNQRPSIHDALKWNNRMSKKPNADNEHK